MTTTLYRDGALADGRSDSLRLGVSILVVDGSIAWIRPADDEGPLDEHGEPDVVDAGGATFVPGMVDCHSHLTLPGGSHWIARIDDPVERLLDVAEHNGRLMTGAGVRWARDVGAPRGHGPGRRPPARPQPGRARSLARPARLSPRAGGRDVARPGRDDARRALGRGRGRRRAARPGDGPARRRGRPAEALPRRPRAAASRPGRPTRSPGSSAAAHARGAKVTAHSGDLAGARVGVHGGVDAIEHGVELDADLAAEMARRGTVLVSTLAVFRSWQTFGRDDDARAVHRAGAPRTAGRPASSGPRRASGYAHAAGRRDRARAPTSAAARRGRTSSPGRSSRSCAAGLEPWEALGAATWRGGELLGEPDAGVIREGGPADFILVHGDPTVGSGRTLARLAGRLDLSARGARAALVSGSSRRS